MWSVHVSNCLYNGRNLPTQDSDRQEMEETFMARAVQASLVHGHECFTQIVKSWPIVHQVGHDKRICFRVCSSSALLAPHQLDFEEVSETHGAFVLVAHDKQLLQPLFVISCDTGRFEMC